MLIDTEINQLFIDFLKKRLIEPLPGLESQKHMAPTTAMDFFRSFKPTKTAHRSAVMVLLTEDAGKYNLLLTLRSKNISHSGQISFPGGRCENGETIEEAALRETFEETGIETEKINIIGRLSDLFVPPSDNIITPVVGYAEKQLHIQANYKEVEEAFFVPLSKLLGNEFKKKEPWDFGGIEVTVPFWDIHPTTPLWGATAMILSEFIEISGEFFQTSIKHEK